MKWAEDCTFNDRKKAMAFIRRHEPSSAQECVDILRKTKPNLNAIKETFLIGLLGFPNNKKDKYTAGNITAYNWCLRQARAENMESGDFPSIFKAVSDTCALLRIQGDPTSVARSIAYSLRHDSEIIEDVQNHCDDMTQGGVTVIDAGRYYGVYRSIREKVNDAVVKSSKGKYTVRRYDNREVLENYLESMSKDRTVYISEQGNLDEKTLKRRKFMKGLLWIIKSCRFQKKSYPTTPPFFVYELRQPTQEQTE